MPKLETENQAPERLLFHAGCDQVISEQAAKETPGVTILKREANGIHLKIESSEAKEAYAERYQQLKDALQTNPQP